MGCSNSLPLFKKSYTDIKKDQPTLIVTLAPQTDLTENEKMLVKSTWSYVKKDTSGNGLQVFLRIFETCPETKKLFHVEDVRLSELARNQVIRGHGMRFMTAIEAAVSCLNETDGKKEKLRDVLFVLGQQHKGYRGFKPEYFEIFYDALMWRWNICMGNSFTTEVSNTWSHVFIYMIEKLKEGFLSKESQ